MENNINDDILKILEQLNQEQETQPEAEQETLPPQAQEPEQDEPEKEPIIRPESQIEADPIPTIIDVGYYTSPQHFGKISETDNETIQFYINVACIELNRLSISDTGTIFER